MEETNLASHDTVASPLGTHINAEHLKQRGLSFGVRKASVWW